MNALHFIKRSCVVLAFLGAMSALVQAQVPPTNYFNHGSTLGGFIKYNCSTGLTCTKNGSTVDVSVAAPGAASATVNLLYATATGTDSATCGSASGTSGCATVWGTNGAMAKIPIVIPANTYYAIDATGVTETITTPAVFPPFVSSGTIQSTGTGNTYFPATAPVTIFATPTTVRSVTPSGGTPTVNTVDVSALRRMTITETLGADYSPTATTGNFLCCSTGGCAPIFANTQVATSTIDYASTSAFSGTCTISTPGYVLDNTTASQFTLFASANAQIQLSSVQIKNSTTSTQRVVSVQSGPAIQFTGCILQGGQGNGNVDQLNFQKSIMLSAGGTTNTFFSGTRISVTNSVFKTVTFTPSIFGAFSASADVFDGCTGVGVVNDAAVTTGTGMLNFNVSNTVIANATDSGFNAEVPGTYTFNNVAINHCGADGIRADGPVKVLVQNTKPAAFLSAVTNAGYGVKATNGASVEVRTANTNVTVTGTSGDSYAGLLGAHAWSAYASAPVGNWSDVLGDQSRIFDSVLTVAAAQLPAVLMTGGITFTDNTLDIGASGATRPRTGYFGTNVVSPLYSGPSAAVMQFTGAQTVNAATPAIAFSTGTANWNSSNEVLQFQNNNGVTFMGIDVRSTNSKFIEQNFYRSNASWIGAVTVHGDAGMVLLNGDTTMSFVPNTDQATATSGASSGNGATIGTSSARWFRVFTTIVSEVVGTVASGDTIAPITGIVHVTGNTTINTITAPPQCTTAGQGCSITVIPDTAGAFALGVTGNIAIASTLVLSRAQRLVYDPGTTKWYPSA